MADKGQEFERQGEAALENVEDRPPSKDEVAEAARRNRSSRDTAKAAAQMKLSGYQDWEIAEVLSYTSAGAARAAYEHVFAEAGDLDQDVPAARKHMSLQYDAVLKSLAPKALHTKMRRKNPDTNRMEEVDNDEHLQYASAFVRVLDRKAVLLGLNAPQVVQLSNPDAVEFQAVVRELLELQGTRDEGEGDIWDAEVVEDNDDSTE